ncbi:MAG: hypothetical protein BWY83_02199 [bacterium ADurb.Bin478]|nr:MAG: hypothetical protein BWY83_02199 [bacterium ADurb.Bin478]
MNRVVLAIMVLGASFHAGRLSAQCRLKINSFCGGYVMATTAAGRITAGLPLYRHQNVKMESNTTLLEFAERKEDCFTFFLAQNYPNPFNPTTTIEFSLPFRDRISLKIFNFLGDQVAVLLDDQRAAGNHRVRWNAAHFANGVYFYILQTTHERQVRKAILMK